MPEYKSSLPVRTEVDADERLQSKIVDSADPTKGAEVNAEGKVQTRTDGVYEGTSNTTPSTTGVVASTRNATPGNSTLGNLITSILNGDVTALDVALRQSDGSAIDATTPLPVVQSNVIPGDEVLDYDQGSSVASDASSNHSYTPSVGKTLVLQQIVCSGSGRAKFEIKLGTTGSEATVAVLFNSTANPNAAYTFKSPQNLVETETVIITKTNLDNQAQDLYSTIEGVEV